MVEASVLKLILNLIANIDSYGNKDALLNSGAQHLAYFYHQSITNIVLCLSQKTS